MEKILLLLAISSLSVSSYGDVTKILIFQPWRDSTVLNSTFTVIHKGRSYVNKASEWDNGRDVHVICQLPIKTKEINELSVSYNSPENIQINFTDIVLLPKDYRHDDHAVLHSTKGENYLNPNEIAVFKRKVHFDVYMTIVNDAYGYIEYNTSNYNSTDISDYYRECNYCDYHNYTFGARELSDQGERHFYDDDLKCHKIYLRFTTAPYPEFESTITCSESDSWFSDECEQDERTEEEKKEDERRDKNEKRKWIIAEAKYHRETYLFVPKITYKWKNKIYIFKSNTPKINSGKTATFMKANTDLSDCHS